MRRARSCGLLLMLIALPLRAEEGFFDSDGVKIHYAVEGNEAGPPVLLIHGYMASGRLNWNVPGVVKVLAPDYKVIIIDNRGHGKSDKPTVRSAYGPNMALDSVRLLDHLKIPRAHVVGYSMGGMITLNLAGKHPDRLLSAAVTGMGWIQAKEDGPRKEQSQLPRPTSPALIACAEAFPDLGITKTELQRITLPMTVIIGSADGLYERRVKPMAEVRPDVPVVLIEGASHLNCMFRGEFKSAVKKFLDEHRDP